MLALLSLMACQSNPQTSQEWLYQNLMALKEADTQAEGVSGYNRINIYSGANGSPSTECKNAHQILAKTNNGTGLADKHQPSARQWLLGYFDKMDGSNDKSINLEKALENLGYEPQQKDSGENALLNQGNPKYSKQRVLQDIEIFMNNYFKGSGSYDSSKLAPVQSLEEYLQDHLYVPELQTQLEYF